MIKAGLKTALVIVSIFILLVGAVFAVFNGIIEIIEETLGNIVNFLSNPLGFLKQAMQDAWNAFVDVSPDFIKEASTYQIDDSETCRFFLSSDMVDQLAENLSSGGVLTENSAYYGGRIGRSSKIASGKPGELTKQGNMDTDGFDQTYTSSFGYTYKDYKQNRGPYADHVYMSTVGPKTIAGYACGICSVADCISGLGIDVNLADFADGMHYTTNTGYLSSLGVHSEQFNGGITEDELANILKSGKSVALHYHVNTGASNIFVYSYQHTVAIVDVDNNGNFMVLNPFDDPYLPSGWYKGSDVVVGSDFRLEVDMGGTGNLVNLSNSSKSTEASLDGTLFIGDSITAELEIYGEIENVQFVGVYGATAEDFITDSDVSGQKTYSALPDDSNDIQRLCIMFGANNVLDGQEDIDKAGDDMSQLLRMLHKKYPNKTIFVQKIKQEHKGGIDEYNKKLEEICNKLDYAICIETMSDVELKDGTHPKPSEYKKLADNIKNAIGREDPENYNTIYSDKTMFKGSLDLQKTGLEKVALRDMILASYITQATTDTVVGVEIPIEEMEEKSPQLKETLIDFTINGTVPDKSVFKDMQAFPSKLVEEKNINDFHTKGENGEDYRGGSADDNSRWGCFRFGRYYFYAVEYEADQFSFYMAEEGIIKVLDGEGNKIRCYNINRFNGWKDYFNSVDSPDVPLRTYEETMFYTVPEIGKIQVLSFNKENAYDYSFDVKEMNYANETEIASATIPLELLVDFLDISASSDFMGAFQELVKDQEIVIRACENKVVTRTTETREQNGNATAEVRAIGKYSKKTDPTTFIRPDGQEDEVYHYEKPESTKPDTKIIDETGEFNLGDVSVRTEVTIESTSVDFTLVLERANTWFMRAVRSVETTDLETVDEYKEPIPAMETNIDDVDSIGPGESVRLHNALKYDDVINQWGITEPEGYTRTSDEVKVLDSKVVLEEGTKTTTVKKTTNAFNRGAMKYDDNTDAFLGLWKNKDGKYHRYAPKYDSDGNIVGVIEEACYDPNGKKVGYLDLYDDEKSYTGDLFVNADKMLFELLEMTENTQAHSYTMKYILSRYTGKDYGVTDFDTLLSLLGILTSSSRDYNVNTRSSAGKKLEIVATSGVSAEQHLIDGINSISNSTYRRYCMVYVDKGYTKTLIDLQEKYGVNPAWIVAQSYYETQCGTTGSGLVNNWFGWDVYGGHTHPFDRPEDCFEQVCKTLVNGDGYFKDGNETIEAILGVWCPGYDEEYPAVCKEIFSDILNGAGVAVGGFGEEFLDVAKQCHDYLREQEYFYSSSDSMKAGYYVSDGKSIGSKIPKPVSGEPKGVDYICYLTWVLYEFKYKELGPNQLETSKIDDKILSLGEGKDWVRVNPNYAEPGDILVEMDGSAAGYVEIYAGDDQAYSAGSTEAIRSETSKCGAARRGKFYNAYRYVGN